MLKFVSLNANSLGFQYASKIAITESIISNKNSGLCSNHKALILVILITKQVDQN